MVFGGFTWSRLVATSSLIYRFPFRGIVNVALSGYINVALSGYIGTFYHADDFVDIDEHHPLGRHSFPHFGFDGAFGFQFLK